MREKDQEIDEPGYIIIASSRCAPTYSATHRNCLARGHRRRQHHCSNSQKGEDHHHPLPRSQWSVVKKTVFVFVFVFVFFFFFGFLSHASERLTRLARTNKTNTQSNWDTQNEVATVEVEAT